MAVKILSVDDESDLELLLTPARENTSSLLLIMD